ncbi:hypothetical protein, partial [Enterococcus faecalis]
SSFLLLSFSIILPYLIVDLKLCNRTLFLISPTGNAGIDYYSPRSHYADPVDFRGKTKGCLIANFATVPKEVYEKCLV